MSENAQSTSCHCSPSVPCKYPPCTSSVGRGPYRHPHAPVLYGDRVQLVVFAPEALPGKPTGMCPLCPDQQSRPRVASPGKLVCPLRARCLSPQVWCCYCTRVVTGFSAADLSSSPTAPTWGSPCGPAFPCVPCGCDSNSDGRGIHASDVPPLTATWQTFKWLRQRTLRKHSETMLSRAFKGVRDVCFPKKVTWQIRWENAVFKRENLPF